MVNKWQEVNLEMFYEILDSYWDKEDWTEGMVLEIQDIMSPKKKVYLSSSITLPDFKEFLTEEVMYSVTEFTKMLRSKYNNDSLTTDNIIDSQASSRLGLMFLDNREVTIFPIGITDSRSDSPLDMLKDNFFNTDKQDLENSSRIFWYSKIGENLIPGMIMNIMPDLIKDLTIGEENSEKYTRIRSIDYTEWRMMIDNYLNGGDIQWSDEDVVVTAIDVINTLCKSD